MEVFVSVKGYPKYEVSRSGSVRRISGDKPLTPSSERYPRVTLYTNSGESRAVPIHRIVAEAWVTNPQPETLTVVNHLDGVTSHYHADNLEWTTTLGNNLHAIALLKPTRTNRVPIEGCDPETGIVVDWFPSVPAAAEAHGVQAERLRNILDTRIVLDGLSWRRAAEDAVLEGEVWTQLSKLDDIDLSYIQYGISNLGRVRNEDSGRILGKHATHSGYHKVILTVGFKQCKTLLMHRLVAAAFLAPPSPEETQVDHINRDRQDNRAENLRWVSTTEHAAVTHGKRIRQEDLRGRLIAVYTSEKEAAVAVGREAAAISRVVCGRGRTCAGYVWKEISSEDELQFASPESCERPTLRVNGTTVVQKTKDDQIVATYPTMREAALAVGGRADSISKAVCGIITSYKGFTWSKA
jgi:hypothetical protein